MAEVAGRLEGVRRLVVPRGAVVTPAVRDELLCRQIALVYDDSADCSAFRSQRGEALADENGTVPFRTNDKGPTAAASLLVVTSGTDFDATALMAALDRDVLRVKSWSSDCLIAAVDRLAVEVAKPDTLGVLLTPSVAAGLCLANRLPGVRAVTGGRRQPLSPPRPRSAPTCWLPIRGRALSSN